MISAHAVEEFCRDRVERMHSPLTKAIYAGLVDRVRRGFFDEDLDAFELAGPVPVSVRCSRCGTVLGEIAGGVTLDVVLAAVTAHDEEVHSWSSK